MSIGPVDRLEGRARLAADYEQGEQASPWPDVYARGIVAGFRG